jgi:hypothetical protein
VSTAGTATSWSNHIQVAGVGHEGQGAGVAFTNLDTNARPEMLLLAYDNPSGENNFRYKIGWNLSATGVATSWGGYVQAPGVGAEGHGAGVAISDIDGNGKLDLLVVAYDNPSGANTFRFRIGWDPQVIEGVLISLNVLGFSTYQSPTGIPNSLATQTAANLYQLSDPVVSTTAVDALLEYVNDCHSNPASHTDELGNPAAVTYNQVLSDPDLIVAAVAWFVDQNMRWTSDATNRSILNDTYGLNYDPGWDFPIPANYTIKYTSDAAFGSAARFHGDCEDHAILRAALLRALGFNPELVWNVIDYPVSHEYNVVAYRGRLRLMDYGPINSWITGDTWKAHRTHYGYSEAWGSRGTGTSQHDNLVSHGSNYPGGAPACQPVWCYHNYYAETCR